MLTTSGRYGIDTMKLFIYKEVLGEKVISAF